MAQMRKYRYEPMLSTGTIACGSTLGVVIPPSVVLIVIGISTEQSIAALFYGGVGAGVLLALLLALSVYLVCRRHPNWGPVGERATLSQFSGPSLATSLWAMCGLIFSWISLNRP